MQQQKNDEGALRVLIQASAKHHQPKISSRQRRNRKSSQGKQKKLL